MDESVYQVAKVSGCAAVYCSIKEDTSRLPKVDWATGIPKFLALALCCVAPSLNWSWVAMIR